MAPPMTAPLSRFLTFDREAWARLRDSTPLTLSESDLDALRGLNERLSLKDIEWWLRLYVGVLLEMEKGEGGER